MSSDCATPTYDSVTAIDGSTSPHPPGTPTTPEDNCLVDAPDSTPEEDMEVIISTREPLDFAQEFNKGFYRYRPYKEQRESSSREQPRTVPVRIDSTYAPGYKVNVDHLLVRISQTWVPVKQWLLSLPMPDVDLSSHNGLRAQRGWWAANGKVFRLLELPAGLRENIYEFALGPKIYPEQKRVLGNGFCPGRTFLDSDPYGGPEYTPPPNVNLLLACKQVHNEALRVAWEKTQKCFVGRYHFVYVSEELVHNPFNALTRIQLDMTNSEYFHLFDIQVSLYVWENVWGAPEQPNKECARAFACCTKLAEVEMHFRNPKEGWKMDPWGSYAPCAGDRGRGPSYPWPRYWSCSKVVDDWILLQAKKHIQHVRTVRITGFIKDSVKTKWDRIFADERKGIHHDMEAEEKAMWDYPPENLPPICSCTTSCKVTDENWRRLRRRLHRKPEVVAFDFED